MFAGKTLLALVDTRRAAFSAVRFALGVFLGVTAVSMWQQFSLTFGFDPVVQLAVGLVMSGMLWYAASWRPAPDDVPQTVTLSSLIWCLCAWTMLHPLWMDSMSMLMGHVPLAWLEFSLTKSFVSLALALGAWVIPGILWSSVLVYTASENSSSRQSLPLVLLGVTCGLLLNGVMLAHWLGVFAPAIAATVMAAVIGICLLMMPTLSEQSTAGSSAITATPHDASFLLRAGTLFVLGILLSCHQRLANQLMPHGSYVIMTQVAGTIAGVAGGLALLPRRFRTSERVAWCGLFAAATASLLLAVQPHIVDLSLWMNARLTNVTWLVAGRVALLVLLAVPFGTLLGVMAAPSHQPRTCANIGWGAPFLCGHAIAGYLLGGTMSVFALMGIGIIALLCTAIASQMKSWRESVSWRPAAVAISLTAISLSLPAWQSHDDASRTAKILFSTPAFVAYRSGWDRQHLTGLDDLRLIHRQEGPSGSLTLWRGRVAELYLREAGIPRSIVTQNADVVPQFAPEVLQAVYSMVLSERPGRVMFLGLSSGVPLATCLNFPIREAVCVEGNSSLIELVRGPLANQTGMNPLSDDRVVVQNVSPELALMADSSEPFDVILSTPSSSSLAASAAEFTSEFYQRASHRLSEGGLFCQRFECLDYGPEPLRIVLKSMRQAFSQTIAIETAAGEFLLFGANSEEVFIPGELASRLETPHVLRILGRSALDWSALLNQPAYDHDALGEICAESNQSANSALNGLLGSQTPFEVMRWGNKHQEVQTVLTRTRLTKAPFWTQPSSEPQELDSEIVLSRRSRLVEWLGDTQVSLELLRRLGEVSTQQKLVHENPDAHWWEYRNVLRRQLQDRPRTVVQQVKAIDEKPTLHPEDVRRRDYFIALGNAVNLKKRPTRQEIAAVETFLEPNDPLLSYFARQEIADLLARCDEDAARELAYRLHVIYFAPTLDASVRNVAVALETTVKHPEAIPDASVRYDVLNGLIQTLRTRWESRQFINQTSTKKVLEDVDQSLIAVEKGVDAMSTIAAEAGVSETDWQVRKQVIERLMLRPLRSYRSELKSRQERSQMQARAIFENLDRPAPTSK
ncbi:spermidine synthase [Schlesneria sp. T3-172]|uniref:spermidine synthase n=1 Tax=Schlesneria sphaerica TaxID=3373610 RepID=UPI0037C93EB6